MENSSSVALASGLSVANVVRPESASEIGDLLRSAGENQDTVVPYGGRRSLATGSTGVSATWGLDLGGMSGVLAYEPADLTLSVRAGTTWAEVQQVLGARGQELPLDIPTPEVTSVGGVVATGFAGARRLRSGTMKDLLIGCEFVRGDGLVAKAGGMVVKNVSGFEIPRFLHGSWGALAVVTSVNLKVVPKPRADGTLVSRGHDWREAIELAQSLIQGDPSLDAVSVVTDAGSASLAMRATGRSSAVVATLDASKALVGQRGDLSTLNGEDSSAHWQSLVDQFSEGDDRIVVAVSCRPRDIPAVTGRLIEAVPEATLAVMPGYGSIRVLLNRVDGEDGAAKVVSITGAATDGGASYVIESAPVRIRGHVPTWGQEPAGLSVMRAVKAEFDPKGVLNPCRLVV